MQIVLKRFVPDNTSNQFVRLRNKHIFIYHFYMKTIKKESDVYYCVVLFTAETYYLIVHYGRLGDVKAIVSISIYILRGWEKANTHLMFVSVYVYILVEKKWCKKEGLL